MRGSATIMGILVVGAILALILFARGTPDHGTSTSPHPSTMTTALVA
jgi:hypothetical protein